MGIQLREAKSADAEVLGRICYEAFTAINNAHNFPPDFPNAETAIGFLSMMIGNPGFHVVVAENEGTIVGSNVVEERGPIAGIGPITVDPSRQNSGAGRLLMEYVLDREAKRGAAGIRLVQAAFHNRSLSLYTKLGFDPREPLSCVQGEPLRRQVPGYTVRPMSPDDVSDCDRLCLAVHGHTRTGEVRDSLAMGMASVVEHGGRITGYATGIAFFTHAVAESNRDLQALIAAAPAFVGPGFLVPTRNAELLRWCLQQGLRITQPLTLMTIGLYNEPSGAYLPSITY